MIEFQNVSKSYKNVSVLKNISLTIHDKELVVIIGLSGSGKTTLLKLINKLITPTSGKILVNGSDLGSKNVIELRRNMGYVVQQIGLFPHMTIRENIEIIEKLEKKPAEDIVQKTIELMQMVGLDPDETLDKYPNQLSGGQQQRVGVARAFAADPDIILMDEPFSALDPITKNTLQDELLNIQSKFNKTIVFVTHDMTEAIKLADRICLMDKGDIVQYDVPEMILKNPANDFVSEFVGKNRIWGSPEFIKATDIMIEHPVTTLPNTSVQKSLDKMRAAHVDTILVVDSKRKLLGVVTSEQFWGCKNNKQAVENIMKTDYPTAKHEDNIVDILNMANETNTYSVPVLNHENYLCGLITKSRLLIALSEQYLDDANDEDEEVGS